MNKDFSVLMSIYYKEKPEYFKECLKSLENQTIKANEWVIVEDGPLNADLYEIINQYKKKYPHLIKTVKLEKNMGLGEALSRGVKECTNELIARMDTDDIARPDRFELQLKEFDKNPNLDVCGSHIKEFVDDISNIVSFRIVPLKDEDIKKYQRRRDGLNHMTVMYKKHSILEAGNYKSCLLMEDTLLWVNMFKKGCISMNIDDFLVYARVGDDLYKRRGGLNYFKKYRNARKKVYDTGYISYWDYLYTIIAQFIICIIPNKLREFIFTKLLHKKTK